MRNLKVRKSRIALKTALLALMKKKAYSKITIKELCEKAGLNRSTFYANYTDIQEVLRDIYTDIFNEFSSEMDEVGFDLRAGGMERRVEVVTGILARLQSSSDFKLLLMNNENNLFEKHLSDYYLKKYASEITDFEKRYMLLYHVMGSFTLTHKWLLDKCPCSPRELARLICTQAESAVKEDFS